MKNHYPKDNDAVEKWLRSFRDLLDPNTEGEAFDAVQELIDDYREAAEASDALSPWTEGDR